MEGLSQERGSGRSKEEAACHQGGVAAMRLARGWCGWLRPWRRSSYAEKERTRWTVRALDLWCCRSQRRGRSWPAGGCAGKEEGGRLLVAVVAALLLHQGEKGGGQGCWWRKGLAGDVAVARVLLELAGRGAALVERDGSHQDGGADLGAARDGICAAVCWDLLD